MFMLITEIINSFSFNNKTMVDFFKHFNNLFKKHNIFKKN